MDINKERNAFMYLLNWIPLSDGAVYLWHILLHIKNESTWPEEFPVSTAVLKEKARLTPISFWRARRELVKYGFIEYHKQEWKSVPHYKVTSLCNCQEFK